MARPAAGRSRRRAPAPGRRRARAASRAAAGATGPATSTAPRAPAGRRPAAARRRSAGGSHSSGPTVCVAGSAAARGYSSAGKVATSASSRRDPAVHPRQRPEPQPPPGLVELAAPALQPGVGQPRQPAPQPPAHRRPRPPRPDRERRPAALGARIEVGDDRRHRHALELGGQRRRQGQDVRHHDVGAQRRHQRPRLPRRPQHGLVGLQRPFERGEDVVLRRRLEAHSRGAHVVLPARPGLQHHLVPARGKRPAQRDERKRVPRVAEGAQQQPQRTVRRRQAPRRAAAARGAPRDPTPSE